MNDQDKTNIFDHVYQIHRLVVELLMFDKKKNPDGFLVMDAIRETFSLLPSLQE